MSSADGGTSIRKLSSYGLAAAVVLADQLSKHWALVHLSDGAVRPLVPGLLAMQLVFNTGAAFSILRSSTLLLAIVSLVVSLALVVVVQTSGNMRTWQAMGIGLLLGGAIGNGLDRWRLGTVVDFIAFVPIRFPIFNGADVAINLAVAALAIDLLRRHGPKAS